MSTVITEIKTPTSDLKIGMYVSRLDKDWSKSSFLLQGFLIETEDDIKQLTQECSYVYVENVEKDIAQEEASVKITEVPAKKSGFSFSNLLAKKQPDDHLIEQTSLREQTHHLSDIMEHNIAPETIKSPKKLCSFSHEMAKAKLAYKKTSTLLKTVMTDVKAGKLIINTSLAEQTIHECITSILRSPDAMLLAMNLKAKRHSVSQHGMTVSILAINLGRHLNLVDEELVTLGLCGMFHDIGNLLISKEALQKADDKKALIRSHTTLGGDLLSKCSGQLSGTVAEVAYSHHENLDGSGFPRGLKNKAISWYTRVISIVALYDTLTRGTRTRKSLGHYEAINHLLTEVEKNHFDATLVTLFNQSIGIYPVGSYVEMSSGEIAVVVQSNPGHGLKPIVMLLTTPDKQERAKKLVNLAKNTPDGKINPYVIKSIINREQCEIEL